MKVYRATLRPNLSEIHCIENCPMTWPAEKMPPNEETCSACARSYESGSEGPERKARVEGAHLERLGGRSGSREGAELAWTR